jgi:hypothetical protein
LLLAGGFFGCFLGGGLARGFRRRAFLPPPQERVQVLMQ